ncbi:MAG: prolipoprotein diacylglyceryl transferase [Bacilli bacterium]
MFPYLDKNHYIPTYGVLFLLGIVASFIVSLINSKKSKLNRDDMMYASAFALVGGMIGAKLLFILTNLELIIASELSLYEVLKSGFVFYGGLLGGALGYFIYAMVYKINVIDFYDHVVCSLPLGQVFGRIGCFCAGCCYGRPTDSFLGVIYTAPADINTPVGVKLLPVQLFESFFCLVLFIVLAIVNRKPTKRGTRMLIYLFGYSVFRFINEIFRYDSIRGGIGILSTSQIISILIFIFALVYLYITRIHKPKREIKEI